jgi:hypothetical protein
MSQGGGFGECESPHKGRVQDPKCWVNRSHEVKGHAQFPGSFKNICDELQFPAARACRVLNPFVYRPSSIFPLLPIPILTA